MQKYSWDKPWQFLALSCPLLLVAMALVVLLGDHHPSQVVDEPDPYPKMIYYPQTGHSVQAPFLRAYLQKDGLKRLGYPITEALEHEGWRVQYFQNGRLEIHPENEPAYFITVGWLGQLSHRTRPPSQTYPFTAGRYFSESGYTLGGDFLTFFEQNGGTVQFGYPIGPPFIRQGRVVQDLQSARFIWYPELPDQAQVQLEPLGETYFLRSTLSLEHLAPISPPLGAKIYRPERGLMVDPNTLMIEGFIEATARPEIVRLRLKVFHQNQPLVGYSLYLKGSHHEQALPPTRSSGQTHILINTRVISGRIGIYDQRDNLVLSDSAIQLLDSGLSKLGSDSGWDVSRASSSSSSPQPIIQTQAPANKMVVMINASHWLAVKPTSLADQIKMMTMPRAKMIQDVICGR